MIIELEYFAKGVFAINKRERRDQILSILKNRNTVTVNFLANALLVSPATIRRDLQLMSEQGLIRHYYGGVTLMTDASKRLPIELRYLEYQKEKMRIAQKALSLISEGDSLFIDASSTCLQLVPGLRQFSNLTIVTNSQRLIDSLSDTNITLFSTGGRLSRSSMSYVGRQTNLCLKDMQFDKCLFSCQAISNDGYLSDGMETDCQIHSLLLTQPGVKIGLFDSGKLNHHRMFKVGRIEQLDYIISDIDVFTAIQKPVGDTPISLEA